MATSEACRSISMEAGEDLTGGLYKFGKVNSSGQIVVNDTAGGVVAGIIAEEVSASGKVTSIVIPDGGRAKVLAGGSFSAGGVIKSSNAGKAIAISNTAGAIGCGIALEDGADGQVVEIIFRTVTKNDDA